MLQKEVKALVERNILIISKNPLSVEENRDSWILENNYFLKSDNNCKVKECFLCDFKGFSHCAVCHSSICKNHCYIMRVGFLLDSVCPDCKKDIVNHLSKSNKTFEDVKHQLKGGGK